MSKAAICIPSQSSSSRSEAIPTGHTPFSCLQLIYLLCLTGVIGTLPQRAVDYPRLEGMARQPDSWHYLVVKLRVDHKCSKKERFGRPSSYSPPPEYNSPFPMNCLWTYLAEFHLFASLCIHSTNLYVATDICYVLC